MTAILDTPAPTVPAEAITASYLITTADRVRLAVREYCPATVEVTIVLSHGWCLSQAEWAHQVDYLKARFGEQARIATYDHRGHGDSDPAPMHTYTVPQLAHDLRDVIEELHVEGPLVLAGHSMGAMSILEYHALPRHSRPIDPAGLVLVATAAGHLCAHGLGRLLGSPLSGALYHLVSHAPDPVLRMLAGPVCSAAGRYAHCGCEERATLSSLTASAIARTPLTTAVGFLRGLARFDATAVLATIGAATVIVSGEADLLTPAVHADHLAATIPAAEHIQLPGAGHMLPTEASCAVNNALTRVLRHVSTPEKSPR